MRSEGLDESIRTAAETAKFDRLFDHFADDIELRIAVATPSPASEWRHGRPSVIARLQRLYGNGAPTGEGPVDVYSSGERVVACRNASFAIAGGLTIRDECALVFDIRDGLIDRLVIQHELSALLDKAEAFAPPVEPRDTGLSARGEMCPMLPWHRANSTVIESR